MRCHRPFVVIQTVSQTSRTHVGRARFDAIGPRRIVPRMMITLDTTGSQRSFPADTARVHSRIGTANRWRRAAPRSGGGGEKKAPPTPPPPAPPRGELVGASPWPP